MGNRNPYRESIWQLQLDAPNYSNSYLHDAALHIYAQKSKFNEWLENDNPEIVANALLLLCLRVNKMLQAQIQSQLENFRHQGGFTENMTVERLNARKSQASASGAPSCPKCGNPMLKRIQTKGRMQGREAEKEAEARSYIKKLERKHDREWHKMNDL